MTELQIRALLTVGIAVVLYVVYFVAYTHGFYRGFIKGREQGMKWVPVNIDIATKSKGGA